MITSPANEKILKYLCAAILIGVVGMQMVALRGLFADGAYFLVHILNQHSFFTQNDQARLFTYWFTQFPTVLAVNLGVRDLTSLTYLFSSWLIVAPILFWGAGLWKLKDDVLFWPFVGIFTVVYFNANFFIVGEYNLSYALSAFCCAMLLRDADNKARDLFLLLFAASVLTMTYASTMFMGALLVVLAWPHLRRAHTPALKTYWLCLIGLFALAIGVGLWSYLYPGIPSNKAKAMDVGILFDDKQIGFMALCAVMLCAQFIMPWRWVRAGLFIVILVAECLNLSEIFRPTPERAFSTRAFIGMMLFALCCAMSLLKTGFLQRRLHCFPVIYCMIPVFILFAECAFFDIKDSFAFKQYVEDFGAFVNKQSGFVPFGTFRDRTENDYIFGWCWTYPSMSLVLRHDVSGAIVLATPDCVTHQLFDPFTQMPDFNAYYAASKI